MAQTSRFFVRILLSGLAVLPLIAGCSSPPPPPIVANAAPVLPPEPAPIPRPDMPPPPTTGSCVSSAEMTYLDAYILKTQLQIAALGCGHVTEYNTFVRKYSSDLRDNGGEVQRVFRRVYRGNATNELNSFVTRIANDISKRSNDPSIQFCALSSQMFDHANQPAVERISELSDEPRLVYAPGFRLCAH